MATKKSTTKKAASTTAPTPEPALGPGGWCISPPSSVLGSELLGQLKKAVRDHELLDEHKCTKRAAIAFDTAYSIARTLALVPPRGAEEALAAAIMLFDEAGDLDQANTWTDERCEEWSLRMKQRASALASWIENTHKVCRRESRLDYFCPDGARDDVLPHAAKALNVNEQAAVV